MKHTLDSACRRDVRAGGRIQRAFVFCVSEIIPRRSTGLHIFPHLLLICSLDRCQTTIPRMEKHKTKYKAVYFLWFYSAAFPGAWLCPCPRRVWSRWDRLLSVSRVCTARPREEVARAPTASDQAALSLCKPDDSGWRLSAAGIPLLPGSLCRHLGPVVPDLYSQRQPQPGRRWAERRDLPC